MTATPPTEAGAIEVVNSKTAIEALRKTSLAELDVVSAGLAKLRRQYRDKVYAVDTPEGMEAAKRARMDLRERRYKVPHIVKAQKSAIRQVAEDVDTAGERIVGALLDLENPIHDQIKAEEDRKTALKEAKDKEEREAKARIDAAIESVLAKPVEVAGLSADEIGAALKTLEEMQITLEEFGEHAGRVEAVKNSTIERLEAMHNAALAHAQEQQALAESRIALEAESLRQAEDLRKQREKMESEQREHNERMAAQRADLEKLALETKAQADSIALQAKKQREENERIERDRQQRLADVQQRINAIKAAPTVFAGRSAADILVELQRIQQLALTSEFFDGRAEEASLVRVDALSALETLHSQAVESERLIAEQREADERAAKDRAAQAAALDAKRAIANELYDALTGLLACQELNGDVCEDTAYLIQNATAVIAQGTPTP